MTPYRPPAWPAIATLLTGFSLCVACGMKGPPLAPLVFVPNAVVELDVQRIEDQVYLRFDIPVANTDGSSPPDLDRVEVYGLTTDPDQNPDGEPPLDDWLEAATLVATYPVRRPDADGPDLPRDEGGVAPGDQVLLVEALVPELGIPYRFEDESENDDEEPDDELEASPVPTPLASPPLPRPPRRTYLVRGVSTRGRESAPSTRVGVPLVDPTPPPPPPSISYTETEMQVAWTAAPGARRPIQESMLPAAGPDEDDDTQDTDEAVPPVAVVLNEADGTLPSRPVLPGPPPSTYLLYSVSSTRDGEASTAPTPLNMAEAGVLSYRDRAVRFGVERCFEVRVLDILDTLRIQGPGSPPTCVIPVDTFPPQPPTGLGAVASDGVISLVWNPSPEPDIAGYLVLRRTSAGATLAPLTPEPIAGTTYRDQDVTVDQNYVYAVQAVDDAKPYNVSVASAEVSEQAR